MTQGRSAPGLGLGENWRQVVTREALRDGSLLAAARRLMPPGTEFLSDAEIEGALLVGAVGCEIRGVCQTAAGSRQVVAFAARHL